MVFPLVSRRSVSIPLCPVMISLGEPPALVEAYSVYCVSPKASEPGASVNWNGSAKPIILVLIPMPVRRCS